MKTYISILTLLILGLTLLAPTKGKAQEFGIPTELIEQAAQQAHLDTVTTELALYTLLDETAYALSQDYKVVWDYRFGSFYVCFNEYGERDVCLISATLKEIELALDEMFLDVADNVNFAEADLLANTEKVNQIMSGYTSNFIAYMYLLYEEFYHDLTVDPNQNGKITRKDLVAKMANAMIDEATAEKVLDGFFGELSRQLSMKDEVTLAGFGTFKVEKRHARVGINPSTGEMIKIAAKKVPKFKAGKALKDAIK
jgi:DNA-binding protein HU-beta